MESVAPFPRLPPSGLPRSPQIPGDSCGRAGLQMATPVVWMDTSPPAHPAPLTLAVLVPRPEMPTAQPELAERQAYRYNHWGTDEARTLRVTRMSLIILPDSWNSALSIQIKSHHLQIAPALQREAAI